MTGWVTSVQRNTRTRSFLAVAGLLLVGFVLRVCQLPDQSLWYDEGVSWYLTGMSLPDLTVWTANDIQPPPYYYLLWFWVRLAGTSEYALRFPSVCFGVLILPLFWLVGRRWLGRLAGWLALLLAVVSPLYVYYAQEARMYTLLTFLGLLGGYLLLRLVEAWGRRPSGLIATAYVLWAVAALYTHYFAFFLLVAHALYVLYVWWRRRRRVVSATAIAIPVAIVVLYLPWLPFLVTRFGVDTSYWPGALNLGVAARKLFVAFSLGETVKEGLGAWLALGYGFILLVSVAALVATGRKLRDGLRITHSPLTHSRSTHRVSPKHPDALAFLLLYLVVPVVLILLLAYRTPKFNPRYAMLASPAFVLLMAGGLSALITGPLPAVSTMVSRIFRLVFAGAIIYIVTTSGYSLSNWFAPYRDNQFNKADFRITAQIVRQRVGPEETVVLSSGHMFPAWAYYYGWQGWHRVPDIEVLDVNAAIDMTAGEGLGRLLQGRPGVWLVRWQNQVTDPFDVLPLYLGTVGEQDDYGQFWHMELMHYNLPSDARFDIGTFVTHPVDADLGGQVRLLGMRHTAGPRVVLLWQAVAAMGTDYTVFAHLVNADGEVLVTADHRPTRPTSQWPVGHIVPDRVSLTLPADLPRGDDYWLAVGMYNAANPAMPRLGPVTSDSGEGQPGDQVMIPFAVKDASLE